MKNYLLFCFVGLSQWIFAQNVILNKVEQSHSNTDKIFYKIESNQSGALYLGELEVQGYNDNDAEVFGKIYKKAKQIGANAFAYQPIESIDGQLQQFDPTNYKFSLYYLPAQDFPQEDNTVYLIASPYRKQNISFNNDKIEFQPRTFTKKKLVDGQLYTVSTRKFLGSSIRMAAKDGQPVQYFQFSAFSVNSNPYGEAGINLKSGDITKLEQSYGQFLTTIYREIQ